METKSLVYNRTMTKLQIPLSYDFGYECFNLASLYVESENIHVRQNIFVEPSSKQNEYTR